MKRLILSSLAPALCLASVSAHAADDRLVSREYNPDEVVRVTGKLGVQATIGFADDEHIENVAVGDSSTWQVTPNKRANLLFVKPLSGRAHTNMTVVTDRRSYYFDLVAAPNAKPVYLLSFTYPKDAASKTATVPAEASLTDAERLALGEAADQPQPVDPAELNFEWAKQGSAKLFPSRIYDDGAATYLSWPADKALPAILVRNEKGDEGPVNYAVRDDVIIIDGVPDTIVLRSGKASATLENEALLHKATKKDVARTEWRDQCDSLKGNLKCLLA